MQDTMWRCSGWHWINVSFMWAVLAGSITALLNLGPAPASDDGPALRVAVSQPVPARLSFAGPLLETAVASGQVSVRLRSFDLAKFDPKSFGDGDEYSPHAVVAQSGQPHR